MKNHLKNILEKLHLENRVQAETLRPPPGPRDEAARRLSLASSIERAMPPRPVISRALAREEDAPRRPERVGWGRYQRMSTIRVLLADDHALLRRGMASLLAAEGGFEVAGEAKDGQQALEMARD